MAEAKPAANGTAETRDDDSGRKPLSVRFPPSRQDLPPLKLEVEESAEAMSPRNMWQVYALGGFLVLRWIWAKWRERSRGEPPEP